MEVNKQNRYVTNSTAHAVCLYALVFLNEQGYSAERIRKMRHEFKLKDLDNKYFTLDELKECFVDEIFYFAKLFVYLNGNDRFENLVNNLEKQGTFKKYFEKYKDAKHLLHEYNNNKIFHKYKECDLIRKDFEKKEVYHKNSDVFYEDSKNKKDYYYNLGAKFLTKLGMKLCNNCCNIDEEKLPKEFLLEYFFSKESGFNTKTSINNSLLRFTKLIGSDPTIAILYYYSGDAKYELGDTNGACSDWQKAAELGYIKANDEIKKYCK